MSWNTISIQEVMAELSPTEQAALDEVDMVTAPPPSLLTNAVNAARGAIIAGGNQIGPDGTIPDQLRADVIAVVRWRWLLSLPEIEGLQNAQRKAAHDDALKRLDTVSVGKIKIEIPAQPEINVAAPTGAVAVARPGAPLCPGGFEKLGST